MAKKTLACLVCQEPLVYYDEGKDMECVFCHQHHISNASCIHGHFVCDACHSKQGFSSIKRICLSSHSKNPLTLAAEIMEDPYIYMHGPEHHVLVGSALLTAYYHCKGGFDLAKALDEMAARGSQVPGGICGLWGSCGAGISTGIFLSIITGSNPLSQETWGTVNAMTSRSLHSISQTGGPRCCKRDSFTAIREAVAFVKEHFDVEMELPDTHICTFLSDNPQCIGKKCPYNPSAFRQ